MGAVARPNILGSALALLSAVVPATSPPLPLAQASAATETRHGIQVSSSLLSNCILMPLKAYPIDK